MKKLNLIGAAICAVCIIPAYINNGALGLIAATLGVIFNLAAFASER